MNASGAIGIVTTYAGAPTPVNGAFAVTQSVDQPTAIAFDGTGGFYVASLHRVCWITKLGKIYVLVGGNTNGFSGDGGPAVSAKLFYPSVLAVDFVDLAGQNKWFPNKLCQYQ
jgi:hypothetical protein